jgi:hypothetical protein
MKCLKMTIKLGTVGYPILSDKCILQGISKGGIRAKDELSLLGKPRV